MRVGSCSVSCGFMQCFVLQVLIECAGKKIDVGKTLVEDGFALVEKRKEKRLQSMVIYSLFGT